MKQITVRNISPSLAQALDRARKTKGKSLNRTVVELLMQALGLTDEESHDNGLQRLAGTWSQDDFAEFKDLIRDCHFSGAFMRLDVLYDS